MTGHTDQIRAVAFNPDGHTLATASTDQTITLWNTDPGTTITTICHNLKHNLTPNEWAKFLPHTPYHPTCT